MRAVARHRLPGVQKVTMAEDKKGPSSNPQEWYLPNRDGDEPLGPYSNDEIRSMLKAGQIRVDEFIWGNHYDELKWRRIQDVSNFQEAVLEYPKAPLPKKLSTGIANIPRPEAVSKNYGRRESSNIFRRYPRVPMKAAVIVHNGHRYVHGICVDLSERGVQVNVESSEPFAVGEELTITLRSKDPNLGTFSVAAVVLRHIGEEGTKNMGLFFQRLSPQIRRKLAHFVIHYLNAQMKEQEVA